MDDRERRRSLQGMAEAGEEGGGHLIGDREAVAESRVTSGDDKDRGKQRQCQGRGSLQGKAETGSGRVGDHGGGRCRVKAPTNTRAAPLSLRSV